MLIANRLTDGLVVFRAADGRWVEAIADGLLIAGEGTAAARLLDAGLADAQANRVIDPYLIDVSVTGGRRTPERYRETIRACGPTIQVER